MAMAVAGLRLCRGRVRDQVRDFNDATSRTTPDMERLKELTLLDTSKLLYNTVEDWTDSASHFKRLAMGLATTISVLEVEKPVSDVSTALKIVAIMKATHKLCRVTGRQTIQSNAAQAIAEIEASGTIPPPSVMLLLQEQARGVEFESAPSECSKPPSVSAIAPALHPPRSWVVTPDQADTVLG